MVKAWSWAFVLGLASLLMAAPLAAQDEEESVDIELVIQQELEALRKGQEQMRKDLAELKKLIQQRPAAAPSGPQVNGVVFDLGDNPVKGEATAKVTLIEFTEYQ